MGEPAEASLWPNPFKWKSTFQNPHSLSGPSFFNRLWPLAFGWWLWRFGRLRGCQMAPGLLQTVAGQAPSNSTAGSLNLSFQPISARFRKPWHPPRMTDQCGKQNAMVYSSISSPKSLKTFHDLDGAKPSHVARSPLAEDEMLPWNHSLVNKGKGMPLANKALPKASLETDARSQLLRSARASKGLAEACTPLSPVSSAQAQVCRATTLN